MKPTITMNNVCAVDTNILIFLHDEVNTSKKEKAENLLSDNPVVSSQVISEYLNTMKRLFSPSKSKLDIILECAEIIKDCNVVPVLPSTLFLASTLIKRYDFQMFDSIVVAASIQAGCSILYSEDMHNNLVVNNTLTIINPFI